MTTARHVVFGTGAIGLATYDALRRRGESVRLVNRSGHAPVSDDAEVIGGDARDSAFTSAVAQGASVVYQTLNPPYSQWTAQFPALQAGVLAAAEATGARLVSMENVYMYGRPNGQPLTEDRAYAAHTKKGWLADHPEAPFHTAGSVEAGIELAKNLAGDGLVCVTAGDVGGQAFSAGLVDEIAMDVAPVVLGEGVRFFGRHAGTVLLDDPDQVVQGDRVLHLHYTVKR